MEHYCLEFDNIAGCASPETLASMSDILGPEAVRTMRKKGKILQELVFLLASRCPSAARLEGKVATQGHGVSVRRTILIAIRKERACYHEGRYSTGRLVALHTIL